MSMEKINDKDAAMVFKAGADEIECLRRQILILQAKAEVIDVFKMALSGKRPEPQGYGEDIAWKLRKAASAIENRNNQTPEEGK